MKIIMFWFIKSNIEWWKKISNIFIVLSFILRRVKIWAKGKKKICTIHGEGTVTDWMYWKRFAKFCTGGFLLSNALSSGEAVAIGSNQMTLVENNQH